VPSIVRQPPSGQRTLFTTKACECNCGSPARDVRWSNTAAASPPVGTWVCPSAPTRENDACPSTYSSAADTAAWCPANTSAAVTSRPMAHRALTDFGADRHKS